MSVRPYAVRRTAFVDVTDASQYVLSRTLALLKSIWIKDLRVRSMQATAAVARRPQILFGLLLRQPLSSVLKTMFIIESASPYRRIEDGIERFGLRLMANAENQHPIS